MLKKLLPLTVATVTALFPISIALSQDDPLCYMERGQQGTIDLSRICGKTSMPQPQPQPQTPENSSQGSDSGQPPAPAQPLDPTVELVPNQRVEPPVVLRKNPSPLWNLLPDLPQQPVEKPAK